MHRIKKILIYLSICTGFIFCFFHASKINTLAIYTDDNNIFGSLPFQLDIDNYDNINLINIPIRDNINNSCGITANVNNNNNIILTGTNANIDNGCQGPILYNNSNSPLYVLTPGTYTLIAFVDYNNSVRYTTGEEKPVWLYAGETTGSTGQLFFLNIYNDNSYSQTITINDTKYLNVLRFYSDGNVTYDASINLMLIKGNNIPQYYSSSFKFGYNVNGRIEMSCPSSNAPSLTFNGYINNNLLFSKTFSSGDSCGSFNIDNVYIPFNIDENGYVSFNANISFEVTGATSLYSISNIDISYLKFTPIYKAYYKGNDANGILYSNFNYTSNNLYLNNFQYLYTNDSIDNTITFIGNKDIWGTSVGIKNNIRTNVISEYIEEVKLTNKFNFNNLLGFSFNVNLFDNYGGQNLNMFNENNIIVSFGTINSRVNNNNSTTTPLPDNELTKEKYNTCSAWYDIPCQLGNAITYVIYEAPIISPIISFFDNFIDLIGSLVTYITWFEGLGLIFGVFIIILFIRMIILLVKGGNDD